MPSATIARALSSTFVASTALMKGTQRFRPYSLDRCHQELMSGEAAKERATTAYARVPSKSKIIS